MNQGARDANERMYQGRVLDLLRSIDASLKVLVERSNPVTITLNPVDVTTTPTPLSFHSWVNS